MPRANRHFLPGYTWHITHRCHNREFLLKHRIDRYRWIAELGEAKRRYNLRILNYIATSNHIHLIERNMNWSGAVAIGRESFLEQIRDQFGYKLRKKGIKKDDDLSYIRDKRLFYNTKHPTDILPGENTFLWDI
jgi:putative transposase